MLAKFGSLNFETNIEPDEAEQFEKDKAELHEKINILQAELTTMKQTRKETKKHIQIKDLPEDKKFDQLSTHSKHFIDTIKMIAYHAETAMVNIVREKMTRLNDARAIIRAVYSQTIDLKPDYEKNELHVGLLYYNRQQSHSSLGFVSPECYEPQLFAKCG